MAAFFAINVSEFPRASDGTQQMHLSFVSKYTCKALPLLPFPPNHSSKSSPSSSILTTLTPTLHSRYRPCSLSNPRNRRLRNAPRNRHIQQHIQSLSQSRAGPPLPAHFQIRTPSHRCPRPIRRLKRFSSQKRSDPDPRGSFERLYCSAETKGRAVLESECSGREKMAWGGCPSRKVSLG
jgi:hypothetical protein